MATTNLMLHAPGMTMYLRAGLGGLTTTLAQMAKEKGGSWPDRIPLGMDGSATVTPRQVTIEWGSDLERALREMLDTAYHINPNGMLAFRPLLPDTHSAVEAIYLQEGLLATTHSHKKTRLLGDPKSISVQVEGITTLTYREFFMIHPVRDTDTFIEEVIKALMNGGEVSLCGTTYPGASGNIRFPGPLVLCALFGAVGCVSYRVAAEEESQGVLVIPEPSDLVTFPSCRRRMAQDQTHRSHTWSHVAGLGDAVLAAAASLEEDSHRRSVQRMHASIWKYKIWNKHAPCRTSILLIDTFDQDTLQFYGQVNTQFRSVHIHGEKGFFEKQHPLRALITENIANHRYWYASLASARTSKGEFLHQPFKKDKGVLSFDHLQTLERFMQPQLTPEERLIITAMHGALDSMYCRATKSRAAGSGYDPGAKFETELTKFRNALAQAKIESQVREIVISMWHRESMSKALGSDWEAVAGSVLHMDWRKLKDLVMLGTITYSASKHALKESNEAADLDTDQPTT